MRTFNIKTKRTFSALRQYGWLFTLTVAFGGLWYPRLGLLVFGVIFSLAVMSLFKGRYWCGNYCAHGSLFDQILLPLSRNRKIPNALKSVYVQAAVMTWFMYNLGSRFVRVAGLWGELHFWDRLGFVFVMSYLMVTIVGGTLGLLFAPRSWCQFCPMGTMQVLMYKLGKILGWTKRTDRKITLEAAVKCHKCAKCGRVCPMQLMPHTAFSAEGQFNDENCIRCLTCVENCPAKALTLSTTDEARLVVGQSNTTGYKGRLKITATITRIEQLSKDVREFTFSFVEPPTVAYLPGQYFVVKVEDRPEVYRAYSAASGENNQSVRLSIKYMPGGYGTSKIFDEFKVGQSHQLEGPMGNALLVDLTAKKFLLVAGGIGITPFIPIVDQLLAANKQVTLIYGVNTPDEFIYDEILASAAQKSGNLRYLKVVASPTPNYTERKGLVTDLLAELDLTDHRIYMCGSKGMVTATTKALMTRGIKEEHISAESA
ncbi:MAG: 4Fe-4S binding protein [Thermaerobacter sp.]|nr:4Fe-4S binding protein [Thermaerobacter sp.]